MAGRQGSKAKPCKEERNMKRHYETDNIKSRDNIVEVSIPGDKKSTIEDAVDAGTGRRMVPINS